MPKLKSNRGARKRFHTTGTGKIMRRKAFKSHILTKKSAKRKRNFRRAAAVSPANKKRIQRQLLA
jgi:large subunit ribosomal protein L35